MQIDEKAAEYATENANQLLANAIAQAYADGFRDGYQARENEIPVDIQEGKTEYVDLGLPSGTLWSKDYLKEDDYTNYYPYCEAKDLRLPTKEQWEELRDCCSWRGSYSSTRETFYGIYCIGPNGNSIYFKSEGYREGEHCIVDIPSYGGGKVYFWLHDDEDTQQKYVVNIKGENVKKPNIDNNAMFSGLKLPVRLVK